MADSQLLFLLSKVVYTYAASLLLSADFSLVGKSRGHTLPVQCAGFLLRWLLLLQSTGSRHAACGLSGLTPDL